MSPNIHSVLVRPKNASNIGSAARATANISKNGKLILISPRTSVNSHSKKMAAGAQATLDARLEYDSWEQFLEAYPSVLRLGLSRRTGKQRKSYTLPEALTRALSVEENLNQDIFLVFGPEEDGLSSEDLDHCHMTAFLPAYGEFKSLNLAQAVILAHYVSAQTIEKIIYGKDSYHQGTLKNFETHLKENAPHVFPDKLLKQYLNTLFAEENQDIAKTSFNTLRRMFLRATPSSKESELFTLMLTKSLAKLEQNQQAKAKDI